MYVPRHFAVEGDAVAAVLAEHGLGELITATSSGLMATLVPLLYDSSSGDHGALLGHIARANDQWRHTPLGEALVILRGRDGYISPGWYAAKREHGKVVPTWDYVAVQVHGGVVFHDDVEWVRGLVTQLTDVHEAASPVPWQVSDAPAGYIETQLRAIVGVEVRISRVEAAAKLSQNRSTADIDGVIEGLRGRGDDELAEAVAAHRPGG